MWRRALQMTRPSLRPFELHRESGKQYWHTSEPAVAIFTPPCELHLRGRCRRRFVLFQRMEPERAIDVIGELMEVRRSGMSEEGLESRIREEKMVGGRKEGIRSLKLYLFVPHIRQMCRSE
ncbi:hypothetical protein FA13DRAFT_1127508 [Coprinellus micaceus]|uniref:Uncharacterized protein n=1 Tax=Coprinellus micaceus TaxID=71717 RepID=A0A4Y7RLA2_COPMI|nr:hypothetical protein FA13DRAFT_1127508 [Coprinellus micaceus]